MYANLYENIGKFNSLRDLERFEEQLLNSADFEEIEKSSINIHPNDSFSESMFKIRYFLNKDKSIWRLIYPDPPFAGVWEKFK